MAISFGTKKAASAIATVTTAPIPTNYGAPGTLVTVFFFWRFIAAANSVFIPFCKHYFQLDQFQSQLVDFAFYTAYYIGALGLLPMALAFAVRGILKSRELIMKINLKKRPLNWRLQQKYRNLL